MWLDVTLHPEWASTFGVDQFPQVVVLKNASKKKFSLHTEELVTESSLSSLLENISSGNGRFKRVPGNEVPELKKLDS